MADLKIGTKKVSESEALATFYVLKYQVDNSLAPISSDIDINDLELEADGPKRFINDKNIYMYLKDMLQGVANANKESIEMSVYNTGTKEEGKEGEGGEEWKTSKFNYENVDTFIMIVIQIVVHNYCNDDKTKVDNNAKRAMIKTSFQTYNTDSPQVVTSVNGRPIKTLKEYSKDIAEKLVLDIRRGLRSEHVKRLKKDVKHESISQEKGKDESLTLENIIPNKSKAPEEAIEESETSLSVAPKAKQFWDSLNHLSQDSFSRAFIDKNATTFKSKFPGFLKILKTDLVDDDDRKAFLKEIEKFVSQFAEENWGAEETEK